MLLILIDSLVVLHMIEHLRELLLLVKLLLIKLWLQVIGSDLVVVGDNNLLSIIFDRLRGMIHRLGGCERVTGASLDLWDVFIFRFFLALGQRGRLLVVPHGNLLLR